MKNWFRTAVQLLVVGLSIFLVLPTGAVAENSTASPEMYFFWGEGCPHCAKQKEFIETWEEKYPDLEIAKFEVYNHPENRKKMEKMAERFGIDRTGVPMTFIGMRHWIGFQPDFAEEMEKSLKKCLETTCLDPGQGVVEIDRGEKQAKDKPGLETEPVKPETGDSQAAEAGENTHKLQAGTESDTALDKTITVPFVGELQLTKSQPLWAGTILIAFVDGFNPCSLWVLSLLLALVIRAQSRKKTLIVGTTYLLITATAYGAFIAGVFQVFQYIQHMKWIRFGVAAVALLFGLTNVKDFFAFKKGLSFTIPERFKPRIYNGLRNLTHHEHSLPALIFYTAIMALGITLVELPCTAGFPVIWNSFLALHNVSGAAFLSLLLLYVLVYLSQEVAIFLFVLITLDVSQLKEKHGQGLKLFGGTLMVGLAGVLIVDPLLMNSISTALYVFGGALIFSLLLILTRKFLPEVQTDE